MFDIPSVYFQKNPITFTNLDDLISFITSSGVLPVDLDNREVTFGYQTSSTGNIILALNYYSDDETPFLDYMILDITDPVIKRLGFLKNTSWGGLRTSSASKSCVADYPASITLENPTYSTFSYAVPFRITTDFSSDNVARTINEAIGTAVSAITNNHKSIGVGLPLYTYDNTQIHMFDLLCSPVGNTFSFTLSLNSDYSDIYAYPYWNLYNPLLNVSDPLHTAADTVHNRNLYGITFNIKLDDTSRMLGNTLNTQNIIFTNPYTEQITFISRSIILLPSYIVMHISNLNAENTDSKGALSSFKIPLDIFNNLPFGRDGINVYYYKESSHFKQTIHITDQYNVIHQLVVSLYDRYGNIVQTNSGLAWSFSLEMDYE